MSLLPLRCRCSMTLSSPAPAATRCLGVRVRRYVPHQDHAAVVDICKHVYGGTDALPRMINEQAAEPHTQVFVAEAGSGRVDALGEAPGSAPSA